MTPAPARSYGVNLNHQVPRKSNVIAKRILASWMVATLFVGLSFAQIVIPAGHYKVETHANPVIVCNVFPADQTGPFSTITLGATTYTFQAPVSPLNRNTEYIVSHNGTNYRLFFSMIPIVDIAVEAGFHAINADDEIRANMSVTDTVGSAYSSLMAIRLRGASSLSYSKKSYRVQLKDADFKNKHESIFGLRSDRRWLMLALYNERLRINNKVCHDLWLDMHKLYYLNEQPDAHSTLRSRYVLAFIDNVYRGLYLFTEDVDAKQYKLTEDAVNKTDVESDGERKYAGGELYKGDSNGAPNFYLGDFGIPQLPSVGSETWAGWEIKLPSVSDWRTLREFCRYIRDRDKNEMQQEIWSSLHKGNFIDYFLFINLVYAEDNLGKNMFMARYKKGDPYFYGVWDLDGTLGFKHTSARQTRGEGFIGNQMWDKIMDNNASLKDEMAVRWFTLRRGLLSNAQILQRIQKNYDYLFYNAAYKLETIVQNRSPQQVVDGGWDRTWLNFSSSELNFMKTFMENRLARMDALIEPWLTSPLPVTLVTFKAAPFEGQVAVDWTTSSEVNAKHFEIEHSLDAVSWQKVGEVLVTGSSDAAASYRFLHQPAAYGGQYYRLKMVDLDATFEYSRIESVVFEGHSRMTVFPNPASSELHIRTHGSAKPLSFVLHDLSGRQVLKKKVSPINGDYSIKVSSLKGLYVLSTSFEDGLETTQRVLID